MLGHPKYNYNDNVRFHTWEGDPDIHEGSIFVIDRYGTFEYGEDVSYDILCKQERVLYKHIKESLVIGLK